MLIIFLCFFFHFSICLIKTVVLPTLLNVFLPAPGQSASGDVERKQKLGTKKINTLNRRSLKCDRLRVHKNFMLSLVIRYLVSVVYYEPYIYGQENPQVWFKELGQVSFRVLHQHSGVDWAVYTWVGVTFAGVYCPHREFINKCSNLSFLRRERRANSYWCSSCTATLHRSSGA